jgi:hypothetical protein
MLPKYSKLEGLRNSSDKTNKEFRKYKPYSQPLPKNINKRKKLKNNYFP